MTAQLPPCTGAQDALAEDLAHLLEWTIMHSTEWDYPRTSPWTRAESQYNPVTRELRIRYRGVWHIVTVREDQP